MLWSVCSARGAQRDCPHGHAFFTGSLIHLVQFCSFCGLGLRGGTRPTIAGQKADGGRHQSRLKRQGPGAPGPSGEPGGPAGLQAEDWRLLGEGRSSQVWETRRMSSAVRCCPHAVGRGSKGWSMLCSGSRPARGWLPYPVLVLGSELPRDGGAQAASELTSPTSGFSPSCAFCMTQGLWASFPHQEHRGAAAFTAVPWQWSREPTEQR